MAQVDVVAAHSSDGRGGDFQVIAVVEDTQTTVDPRGRTQPTVVAIRLVNTSQQAGSATWQQPNGTIVTTQVLPGENQETNIAPPQRQFFHELPLKGSWS